MDRCIQGRDVEIYLPMPSFTLLLSDSGGQHDSGIVEDDTSRPQFILNCSGCRSECCTIGYVDRIGTRCSSSGGCLLRNSPKSVRAARK